MNVSLYTFAKKKNSTATPSSTPVVYSCTLKAGCSIMNPTIGLDIGLLNSPESYNYAAIGTFSRFYYVKDWYWDNRLWWANLTVDILATYKTDILNNTAYVARASKTYDGAIIDSLYPATTTKKIIPSYWPTQSHSPWQSVFSSGFYVVGIINNDSLSIGAVSYYAFTPAQFSTLKSYLLGDTTWTGILTTNPDIGENLYKSLFNPFQYISTVNWFPVDFNSSWGTSITTIKFGWWELSNIACYRLTTYITSFSQSLYGTEHPQASARGKYLNGNPYTLYRLIAPPWGEFVLDGSLILNGTYTQMDTVKVTPIDCAIQVDFISGQGDLYVTCTQSGETEHPTLIHSQTMVSVPIQIAQINDNTWGNVRNVAETAGRTIGAIFNADVSGAISNGITGILDGIENMVPHSQEKGNNGSIGAYRIPFILENIHCIVCDDALSDKGRPLCVEEQLGNLNPGYVLTVGAHVSISGYEDEISQLNNMLDRGVYLE